MVAEDGPQLETPGLRGARADFAARLSGRLGALRRLVATLEHAPDPTSQAAQLKTSFRALARAATVLGFERVAGGFEQAEHLLDQVTPERPLRAEDAVLLHRILGRIPSFGWDAPVSLPESRNSAPRSVVAFVPPPLVAALEAVDPALSLEVVATAAELEFLPPGADAVLVDAELPGAGETIDWLLAADRGPRAPLVVMGSSPEPELIARLMARGVSRVVSKPASPRSLARLLRQLGHHPMAAQEPEPLGELTVPELGQRLAAEVHRRLLDGMDQDGARTRVALGDGSEVLGAVWSAVARVQNAVTLRSRGAVRFESSSGEMAVSPTADASPAAGAVELAGRRAVVADDDPALVWFLSSLLTSNGVEVLEAHDGRRAFELVAAAWPDFVLSDVLMPELDGCGLCREIKRDVAVRDVPVLLFSWKEDLLEHLRELGVGADAYLTKDATSDTVLRHIRRALGPRSRWEQQLDAGGEMSGELAGLTPRLLLSLVASRGLDAQVRLQDATFVCEAELRQGRLRSVTRSSTRGSFERGRDALARLLGMSAGHFIIVPSGAPGPTEFAGSLPEVLAPHIVAARAAVRAVGAESLLRVERLVLDEAAVAVELGGLPGPSVELLEQIRRGVGPRELCTAGYGRMLEAVLGTLARRGAVLGVYGPDGEDLLGPASDVMVRHDSSAEESPAPSFTIDLTLPADEPSVPMLVIDSPWPPRSAPLPQALAAAMPWEEPEPESVELESVQEPSPTPAPAEAEPAWLELRAPGGSESGEANAESSALVVSLADEPAEDGDAAEAVTCDAPHPCAVDWRVETEALPGQEIVASLDHTAPWPSGRVAQGHAVSPVDEIDLGWDDLIGAAVQPNPVGAEPSAEPESDAIAAAADGAWVASAEGLDRGVQPTPAAPEPERAGPSPMPEAVDASAEQAPADDENAALDAPLLDPPSPPPPSCAPGVSANNLEPGAEPARAVAEPEAAPVGQSVPASPARVEPPPSPEAAETSADQESADIRGAADEQARQEPDFRSADFEWDEVVIAEGPLPALPADETRSQASDPSAGSEPEFLECEPEPAETPPSPDWAEIVIDPHPALPTGDLKELLLFATQPPPTVSASADPPAMSEANALPVRKIELPARFAQSSRSPRPSAPEPASARQAAVPPEEATPFGNEVHARRPSAGGWMGIGRTALMTALAAGVSFGAVRWWVAPGAPRSASASVSSAGDPAAAGVASAPPVGSLFVVKAKSVSEQAKVRESELPAGTTLPSGKGLLEVSTGDRHAIHVDDAFVGLGPVRPVVLAPGQHQVRVRLDGVDKTFPVTVASARLVRLDVVAP